MAFIDSITLEVADPAAATDFYQNAFDLGSHVRLQEGTGPTSGFRGFTLSLIVPQPANASSILDAALAAGATALKPAAKSLWGFGGVIQAPDGTIWKVATSARKNTEPPSRKVDDIVLLLGVADVAATKRFYLDRGLTVAKSFGRTYAEFAAAPGGIKLALYRHRALAKDAGVAAEGSGSHRIVLNGDVGSFTDPDGFTWQAS